VRRLTITEHFGQVTVETSDGRIATGESVRDCLGKLFEDTPPDETLTLRFEGLAKLLHNDAHEGG